MKTKVIARTVYKKGFYLEFTTGFNDAFKQSPDICDKEELKNDIQITLLHGKNTLLSAICKFGSYGVKTGLWEIMPNNPPKKWRDSICGYLTFAEVIKYINKEIKIAS